MLPEGWQMVAFAVVYVGLGVFAVIWGLGRFVKSMSSASDRRSFVDRLRGDLLGPGGIILVLALLGILSKLKSG